MLVKLDLPADQVGKLRSIRHYSGFPSMPALSPTSSWRREGKVNVDAPSTARRPKDRIAGLYGADYKGGRSTLCAGCGHDAITEQIIKAFYEWASSLTASPN